MVQLLTDSVQDLEAVEQQAQQRNGGVWDSPTWDIFLVYRYQVILSKFGILDAFASMNWNGSNRESNF